MKFNRFLWDLYTQSGRGTRAVAEFSELDNEFVDPDLREYVLGDDANGVPVSVDIAELIGGAAAECEVRSQDDARQCFSELLDSGGIEVTITDVPAASGMVFVMGDNDEDWYDYIAAISLGLHAAHPEYFLPYGFRGRFGQLEEIHADFGIPLPPLPGKSNKRARAEYYMAINQTWQEFRQRFGLSPPEMCAFLYDFAREFTTPLKSEDLPSPAKAWLISGGACDDFEFLNSFTESTTTGWAGNAGVRRGDILLMYQRSPRSRIDSIWRAASDASIDPFYHYHSQVQICSPQGTVPVTFGELMTHPLLSKKSAVRGHFQGPSSKAPFTFEEYEAVLGIMETKGQDITVLPRIPVSNYMPEIELQNERDVEVHLIEPFLKRLGYGEADWVRQMPVRMGRGERNYPDYAFGARVKRGEEGAEMICESKYQLSAQGEFTDAFYQAKSYALRLRSKILVTAAREGVWAFPPDNGNFEIKKYVHKSWGELNRPDDFHSMLCMIGRDKILGRSTATGTPHA